jgi:hypothetical protein
MDDCVPYKLANKQHGPEQWGSCVTQKFAVFSQFHVIKFKLFHNFAGPHSFGPCCLLASLYGSVLLFPSVRAGMYYVVFVFVHINTPKPLARRRTQQ